VKINIFFFKCETLCTLDPTLETSLTPLSSRTQLCYLIDTYEEAYNTRMDHHIGL